jgi:hypothetical protein
VQPEQKFCLVQPGRQTARDVQKWKATSCTMDLPDRGNAALSREKEWGGGGTA